MRPAPDLADPVQRAAYRGELRRVAWPLRVGAVVVTLAGACAVMVSRLLPAAHQAPRDWLQPAGFGAIAAGAAGMLAAIIARTRHHRRRMAGQAMD